uniref:WD repeat-containing and planar cell polarity effector protein fritz homolog n=1 Tax=Phallusia mammillata TaxID=59560 RepID=A0A6F9DXE8_9ASCI|nr:WD repeat-containing and planar cell polarity effector protein fritz homolog [Phallusia mammillata]
MAGFGFSLKFWTLQQNLISDKDIGVTQFYDKEVGSGEYYNAKKAFVTSRGEIWTPRNKRPYKLRENIKLLDEALKSSKVLHVKWSQQNNLQLSLSSGLLADANLTESGEIQKITFEKSLIGKITNPSSGIYASTFACFAFEEQSKLSFFTVKSEIKISTVDIPGPQARLKRHLMANMGEDMLVCWWKHGSWVQTASENERLNLVLLGSSFGRLEVLSSIKTEHDLIAVEFSQTNTNQVLTLEKSYNVRNERHLDSVVYECTRNKIQRLNVISFSLKHGVLSSARNRDEDRLVVGCSNGSIVLFDLVAQKRVAVVTRQDLVPTSLLFTDGLVVVGSSQGQMVIYDSALNPLKFFNMQEDESDLIELSSYLTSENGLLQMTTNNHNTMILTFSGGPLALFKLEGKLGINEILHRHITNFKIEEAVRLLCSLNWNYNDVEAYHGLMNIADHLMKQPLNHDRELQLEATFSSFYSSPRPISDGVVLKYRHTIGCYARRFFHHLLRYRRFEKAFLLAKDIHSSDLFLDIYFEAKEVGDNQLAKLAKLKADEIIAAESSDGESVQDAIPVPEVILQTAASHRLDEVLDETEANNQRNTGSSLKVTNLGYV